MWTIQGGAVDNYEESEGILFGNKGKASLRIVEWMAVVCVVLR